MQDTSWDEQPGGTPQKGLSMPPFTQEAAFDQQAEKVRICEQRRQYIDQYLFPQEKDWRLSPGDGGDPATVSEFVLQRELTLDRMARQRLAQKQQRGEPHDQAASEADYLIQLAEEKDRLKYFPVLFISAPHLESEVSGTFPGIPTPLLNATSVLDRHLYIDEFPCWKVPRVVGVMNPMVYNQEFLEQLRQYVTRFKPHMVGISNLSEGHYFALQIARQVKALSPETIILLGGAHEDGTNPLVYRKAVQRVASGERSPVRGVPRPDPLTYQLSEAQLHSLDELQTLAATEEQSLIDFVAAGDAPYLVMEFMKIVADHLEASAEELKQIVLASRERFSRVEGSGYLFFYSQTSHAIEHVELSGQPLDRDRLPFLFLEHLTQDNRFPIFHGKKTVQVMACAGCKYTCTFCHESADHTLYGLPKLQERAPENVIKELNLRKEQGYEAVFFDDSTFTQRLSGTMRLLALMKEQKEAQGDFMEWGCQTTINDVNCEILRAMAEAGCTYIYFGLESANPLSLLVQKAKQLHVRTGRDNWANRFKEVAAWCHEAGIRVGTSLQFGLDDTPLQRQATLDLVAEVYRAGHIAANSIALNINAPYPGTDEWIHLLKREGYRLPDYREKLTRNPAFETAHQFTALSPAEIDEIYALAREKLGDALLSVEFARTNQVKKSLK
jgi:radical SAM superfamily enzyme YgiQ (UPF0313 family)